MQKKRNGNRCRRFGKIKTRCNNLRGSVFTREARVRISGGVARGIPLKVPKGDAVRPATDGLRQSVFSSLGGRVVGARTLDLCAGSGAYGLEALSRGAAGGVAVEKSAKAVACLRENIAAVAKSAGLAGDVVRVAACDLAQWTPPEGFVADLVFVDPPYERIQALAPAIFACATRATQGAAEPLVIFEMPGEQSVSHPEWLEIKRIGRGGGRQPSAVVFGRK
ncbi:RsmD family RNA methyltransferase [Nibricoccus sp. IMCC34717]|uniref:RsmD family RNA methyltransferase n=1 Tax=Nibricoccus sp. IMCC34717 TaxID=3034021 RepID=UPI00384AABA9